MKKRLKEPEIRELIGKWLEDNEEWMSAFLREHDFDMFEKEMKISQVARLAREKGLVAPLRSISILVKDNAGVCDWWRRRLKPISRTKDSLPEYWDKLKSVVEKHQDKIRGKGLTFAMRVVRRFVSTNEIAMNGLPERLKVWNR